MEQKMRVLDGGQGTTNLGGAAETKEWFPGTPACTQPGGGDRGDITAGEALERMKTSLVLAYVSANLKVEHIPLRAFMDGFEKKMLLACLRLTRGNQKNAAALLGLKPTALFEKMRKHRIRSQRGRLPGDAPGS